MSKTTMPRLLSDGQRSTDAADPFYRHWHTFTSACSVIRLDKDAAEEMPTLHAEPYFACALILLEELLHCAQHLRHAGASSANPAEQEAARQFQQHFERLRSLIPDPNWLPWLEARTVFLINFRELLAKHEGEYVVVAPAKDGKSWEIAGIDKEPRRLVIRLREAKLLPEQFFIQRIVPGAENISYLDLARPESGTLVNEPAREEEEGGATHATDHS